MITPLFDVETIIGYLHHLEPEIGSLRLQQGLYFLFAYYGALYGQEARDGVFEGSANAPTYLFDTIFEAWQYGPIIKEVWFNDKQEEYYSNSDMISEAISKVSLQSEIQMFIDELFGQINSINVLKLIDRSHMDKSWKEAYRQGRATKMDNDVIIAEYIERYM